MTTLYTQRYRDAFSALSCALGAGDQLLAGELSARERQLAVRLPQALREYYLLAGRAELNRAHNRLYLPDEWFVDSGKLVFMEENQSAVFWAVDAGEQSRDDPPIQQGVNATGRPIEWHSEHDSCSEFLAVMLYWQAVSGGMEWVGTAEITSRKLRRIEAEWPSAGRVRDLRAYGKGGGRAVCVIGDGEELQLYAAGQSEDEFAAIEEEMSRAGIELDQL